MLDTLRLPSGLSRASSVEDELVGEAFNHALWQALMDIELEKKKKLPGKKLAQKGIEKLASSGAESATGYYAGHPSGGFAPDPSGIYTGHPSGGFAPNRAPALPSGLTSVAAGTLAGLGDYLKRGEPGSALMHGLGTTAMTAVNPVLGAAFTLGLGGIQDSLYGGSDKPRVAIQTVGPEDFLHIRRPYEAEGFLEEMGVPYTTEYKERELSESGRTVQSKSLTPDKGYIEDLSFDDMLKIAQADDKGIFAHAPSGTMSQKYPYAIHVADTGNDTEIEKALVNKYDSILDSYAKRGIDVEKLLMESKVGKGTDIVNYDADALFFLDEGNFYQGMLDKLLEPLGLGKMIFGGDVGSLPSGLRG